MTLTSDAPAAPQNPLRDPRDRRLPRVAGPCGMVIFGVTGDLARKKLIPAGNFHEVRYEDLVARPVEELQKMYQTLGMGGFDAYRPRLEDYLKANADYQTNRWPTMSDELKAEIARRWAVVIERYGYTPPG